MGDLTAAVRAKARQLLETGEVKLVIGHARGSTPYRARPHFATSVEAAEELIHDLTCANNLAVYVNKPREKVAVIAKGCDARSLITLASEGQADRADVVVIGVTCEGKLDEGRLLSKLEFPPRHIKAVREEGEEVVVEGLDGEVRLPREEVIMPACTWCRVRTPAVCNEMLGEPVPPAETADTYPDLEQLEAMSAAERAAFWYSQLNKCIRCYACRNACPLCYCPECFVDEYHPQWAVHGGGQFRGNWMFHLGRAQHLAGRCSACGSCERVCPVGIPLMLLNRWMERTANQAFDHLAGMAEGQKQLAALFRRDEGIVKGDE
ncbi:MAG: 4Fe-4S dicluster domain-containing protein [Candidatus Zipacnadales bacterium]